MSQAIRQRSKASGLSEKAPPVDSLDSYDLALKVYSPADPKTKQRTPEAENSIKRLLKTLDLNQFTITVRPDDDIDYLLVFVKLDEKPFAALLKRARQVDSLYGVSQLGEELTSADRVGLVNYKLSSPKSEDGAGITVGQGKWAFVTAVVPVSGVIATRDGFSLFKKTLFKFLDRKTTDAETNFLLKNFGSRYSFYFKVVHEYIAFLLVLSAIGVVTDKFFGRLSKVFTALNLLVGVSFYLCWYGSEKKWAKEWKLQNVSHVHISRTERKDPPYKVLLKKVLFAPIALGATFNLVFYQFACFLLEIFLTELYQGPFKFVLSLVPTIVVSTIVPVCTAFYSRVVNEYLVFENNPTKAAHSKSYLVKLFVYNFLAGYVPLYITSFIYLPVGYKVNPYLTTINQFTEKFTNSTYYLSNIPLKTQDYSVNSQRLNGQFSYFILTNQIIQFGMEFGLPVALSLVGKILAGSGKTIQVNDLPEEKQLLSEIRSKLALPELDIDGEYRQFVMQFGYLILFGPTWSLGPIVSLIVEVIESKADFFKIVNSVRPPVPERAESSYPWPFFLKVLLVIGSFTSVCVTLMYNGGDLVSYVDKTSVKTDWLSVLPWALLAAILTQAAIYSGETVIDEYYKDTGAETAKRWEQLKEILKESEQTDSTSSNDIDGLIGEALKLPVEVKKGEKVKKQE
ncbi:DEKNAAC102049 [Brettanomyces naardenensis]|uniref:DEKNAAC102049 n=1 Tax=Brettanomyces naardenensis TaxID=13370 RepID=A0A448YJU8_BRENA|nr:DEKNAAC102049 [Brettanomyces naardenensis]